MECSFVHADLTANSSRAKGYEAEEFTCNGWILAQVHVRSALEVLISWRFWTENQYSCPLVIEQNFRHKDFHYFYAKIPQPSYSFQKLIRHWKNTHSEYNDLDIYLRGSALCAYRRPKLPVRVLLSGDVRSHLISIYWPGAQLVSRWGFRLRTGLALNQSFCAKPCELRA